MDAVFQATFHNTKYILGRKVMQIILEIPIEKSAEVHEILGWPDPAAPQWVAVALLKENTE
jgi:hypothetical protein